jgi:serine/threonine protein phosphatase PrpC
LISTGASINVTGIFHRFTGKKKTETPEASGRRMSDDPTIPLAPKVSPGAPGVPSPLEPPQFLVGIGHSVGRQRGHNEDALFTYTTNLLSDTLILPFGFYVVADGMGGHKFGEKASAIAVRAMAASVLATLSAPLFSLPEDLPPEKLQNAMQAGILAAHETILEHASGGGSTLTSALVLGDTLIIAHIGDSRAYAIYPEGVIQALTRDHSLVKRLVELGQISIDEAANHPQRNVLYRALGQIEPLEAEFLTMPIPRPGFLLLCSDGLWGLITDEDIRTYVIAAATPTLACQALVEAANLAGGPDNITAVLIQFPA